MLHRPILWRQQSYFFSDVKRCNRNSHLNGEKILKGDFNASEKDGKTVIARASENGLDASPILWYQTIEFYLLASRYWLLVTSKTWP